MLSAIYAQGYKQTHYAECQYAECRDDHYMTCYDFRFLSALAE